MLARSKVTLQTLSCMNAKQIDIKYNSRMMSKGGNEITFAFGLGIRRFDLFGGKSCFMSRVIITASGNTNFRFLKKSSTYIKQAGNMTLSL